MALLKIARLGNPVLRRRSDEVTLEELASPGTQGLIDDMIDTMRDARGVGIAAPQVHVGKRIFIIEVKDSNPRYPNMDEVPVTAIVNPRIISASEDTEEGWESCLSIPDLRGNVPRHASVVIECVDREGSPLEIEASGFLARIIQHESDHLDGVLFIDRMTDLTQLAYPTEFEDFWMNAPESGLSVED